MNDKRRQALRAENDAVRADAESRRMHSYYTVTVDDKPWLNRSLVSLEEAREHQKLLRQGRNYGEWTTHLPGGDRRAGLPDD